MGTRRVRRVYYISTGTGSASGGAPAGASESEHISDIDDKMTM